MPCFAGGRTCSGSVKPSVQEREQNKWSNTAPWDAAADSKFHIIWRKEAGVRNWHSQTLKEKPRVIMKLISSCHHFWLLYIACYDLHVRAACNTVVWEQHFLIISMYRRTFDDGTQASAYFICTYVCIMSFCFVISAFTEMIFYVVCSSQSLLNTQLKFRSLHA